MPTFLEPSNVVKAYVRAKMINWKSWPEEILALNHGLPEDVCKNACKRAIEDGLLTAPKIAGRVNLHAARLTPIGRELIGLDKSIDW